MGIKDKMDGKIIWVHTKGSVLLRVVFPVKSSITTAHIKGGKGLGLAPRRVRGLWCSRSNRIADMMLIGSFLKLSVCHGSVASWPGRFAHAKAHSFAWSRSLPW